MKIVLKPIVYAYFNAYIAKYIKSVIRFFIIIALHNRHDLNLNNTLHRNRPRNMKNKCSRKPGSETGPGFYETRRKVAHFQSKRIF